MVKPAILTQEELLLDRGEMLQLPASRRSLFSLNFHAIGANPLTKHEREHSRIIFKHHKQCHTPEQQMGLQDDGKVLNARMHAAEAAAITPEQNFP